MDFLFVVFLWGLSALLACYVAGPGKRGDGFVIGLVLGPFGVITAAILGNRASTERTAAATTTAIERLTLAVSANRGSVASSAPTLTSPTDGPTRMTIRRHGEVLGAWPYDEVVEFLRTGELVWTDEYLHDPAKQTWRVLSSVV